MRAIRTTLAAAIAPATIALGLAGATPAAAAASTCTRFGTAAPYGYTMVVDVAGSDAIQIGASSGAFYAVANGSAPCPATTPAQIDDIVVDLPPVAASKVEIRIGGSDRVQTASSSCR